MLTRSWIPAVLFAASAAAQGRVWVVDSAEGPGTDFTNLFPAIAAAADGDVLLVRSGEYWFINTVDARSLTIAADGIVHASGILTVQNLAAHQRVTLRGLDLEGQAQVQALQNAGVVWIEGCTIDADMVGDPGDHGAVYALGARLVLQESHVFGSMNQAIHDAPPTPGLELVDSIAAVSGGSITGGAGNDPYAAAVPAAPGIVARGSTLVVSGTAVAGGLGDTAPGGTGVVAADGSSVTLRAATVAGGAGTPAGVAIDVEPGSTVTLAPGGAHGLTSTATPREGQPLTVTATGAPGDGVLLLVASAPLLVPTSLGPSMLLVSPAPPSFSVVLGTVAPSGSLDATFTVPSLGATASLGLFVQDVYLDAALAEARLGPGTAPLLLGAAF